MKNSQFKQKAKVGVAGNLINQLMSNNQSLPEVGKGATQMHYSDRTCYEVIEVSADMKTVKLEYLDAEWDQSKPGGCGHQNWILKPTGRFVTVVWRHNAWKTVSNVVSFTKEFKDLHKDVIGYANQLTKEQRIAVYGDPKNDARWTGRPINVVEGITKQAKEYNPINLLFGVKDYRYDWEF